MGFSNGVFVKIGVGFVGFFYEFKIGSRYGFGFVIVFYVVIESCYYLCY